MRAPLTTCLALAIASAFAQVGANDSSFDPGAGVDGSISDLLLQPDGKILIGGNFTAYDGTLRNYCARLNTDGILDTVFDPGAGTNAMVNAFALQPDGRILIVGLFTTFNGTPRYSIARLNSDGSLDPGFDHVTGANGGIQSVALQPDGRILIGGWFTTYDGTPRNHIARLNGDGSLDGTFDPGTGASGASDNVYAIAVQPDGKVVLGGWFAAFNGVPRNNIARVNSDGTLDAGFDPGTGADNNVWTCTLQPDGKILVSGDFITYNGTGRNYIARLNMDGGLDTAFDLGTGANNTIWDNVLQPDGKILVAGSFWMFDGSSRNRLARLNADGSLDSGFDPGTGTDNIIVTMAVQPDAKILIGGAFDMYNDSIRHTIARILVTTGEIGISESAAPTPLIISPNPVLHTLQFAGMSDDCRWSITDAQGRMLLQGAMGRTAGQGIDISSLVTGSYQLLAHDGVALRTARFIKW
jgi:uncharacterized delta-60 repeat protein